jgi:hypothetical protein
VRRDLTGFFDQARCKCLLQSSVSIIALLVALKSSIDDTLSGEEKHATQRTNHDDGGGRVLVRWQRDYNYDVTNDDDTVAIFER